jgi:hypothetical protein
MKKDKGINSLEDIEVTSKSSTINALTPFLSFFGLLEDPAGSFMGTWTFTVTQN